MLFFFFALLLTISCTSVQLCSNVATADMLSLFTEPNLWPNSRSKISSYKFYIQQLLPTCPTCGNNTVGNLEAVGAFRALSGWGIEYGMEAGVVKPNDCQANAAIASAQLVLSSVPGISFISMDEPFSGAKDPSCAGQAPGATADSVARYMGEIGAAHGVKVGLIESYPSFSAADLLSFLNLLASRSSFPAFFHLDFDFWLARNRKMSDKQVVKDIQSLQQACRSAGVPFGIILWGHDGDNAGKFSQDLLALYSKIKQVNPDVLIFQSWATTSNGGQNINPPNLPESNPQSLTGTLLKVV